MYLTQHQELGQKKTHATAQSALCGGVPRGDSFRGDFSGQFGTCPGRAGESHVLGGASETSCFLFKLYFVLTATRNLFRKGREESSPWLEKEVLDSFVESRLRKQPQKYSICLPQRNIQQSIKWCDNVTEQNREPKSLCSPN